MKKLFELFSARFVFVPFLLVMLFAAACNKNDNDNNQQGPVAGLMAFNLAPGQPNVAFTISNNYLSNSTFGYTNYSGSYLPIYVGDREVRSIDYNTGSTLAIARKAFADSNYYSVFLLGYNGAYKNIITTDTLTTLAAAPGKAWVRYINAVADSTATPTVNIAEGSETAVYGSVSGFKQVNAGSVSTGINSTAFSTTRDITLEENKIYTVLFVGDPGMPSDEIKKVQVKFITNGTITP